MTAASLHGRATECTGCKRHGADTKSVSGGSWHQACLSLYQSDHRKYCSPDSYPVIAGLAPLPRPWTDAQFLGMLTRAERRCGEPPDRLPWPYDFKHYCEVLHRVLASLPPWRLRPSRAADRYAIPIMERQTSARETLGNTIQQRKSREAAEGEAARKAAKKAAVTAKYTAKISVIAALCRKQRVSTLADIRRVARRYLGVSKIERDLPGIVQEEIGRQSKTKRWPSASQTAEPVIERWPNAKVTLIKRKVWAVINKHYHTPNSIYAATHYLDILFGTPNATSKKSVGEWHKYGRMGYRPVYHDWHTTLTIPGDWLTKIGQLGTAEVEGKLILDVHDALCTTDGAEAYAVDALVQHAGIKVSVQRMAIHRVAGQAWRIGKLPVATRYDRIVERPAVMRKPARPRSAQTQNHQQVQNDVEAAPRRQGGES